MLIAAGAPHPQLDVAHPLEAEVDEGLALFVDAAELPDAGVGPAKIGVIGGEVGQVRRADLLFALGDELDGEGKVAADVAPGIDRGDPGREVALVVADPAAPEATVLLGAGPRIVLPQIERVGGLHVVVVVEAQGLAGFAWQLCVDNRKSASGVVLPR